MAFAPAASLTRGPMASPLARSHTTSKPALGASRVSLRMVPKKEHSAICNVSSEEPTTESFSVEEITKRCSVIMDRYDFLSAGLGALAVTTVCVARGQDPMTALWITAASTVVALLVNDALFTEK